MGSAGQSPRPVAVGSWGGRRTTDQAGETRGTSDGDQHPGEDTHGSEPTERSRLELGRRREASKGAETGTGGTFSPEKGSVAGSVTQAEGTAKTRAPTTWRKAEASGWLGRGARWRDEARGQGRARRRVTRRRRGLITMAAGNHRRFEAGFNRTPCYVLRTRRLPGWRMDLGWRRGWGQGSNVEAAGPMRMLTHLSR